MSLVTTLQVGAFRVHALEAGTQRLDGGAMFGVVPRPLWERKTGTDARHRIPLGLRCLLIEHPTGPVLVDTGIGDKENPKFQDIYGVENAGSAPGPTLLEDALGELGLAPADVRTVINTHLHFDHAGGNTRRGPDGEAVPAFPEAEYVVQARELDFARNTNERTQASYLPPNFEPLERSGQWRLIAGDGEILPGIHARITPGHVPWHQAILIESEGQVLAYVADLIPTTAHLPLAWIMGYDLEPLRTLESKRALIHDAVAGGWTVAFEHDPMVVAARVVEGERGPELSEPVASQRPIAP